MAKKIVSKTNDAPAKKAPATKKAPAATKKAPSSKSDSPAIDQVCVAALKKLQELNLDSQLQGEIEWCLASYANDGNAIGLYQMAERALNDFDSLVASQPKAVPAKLLNDLKKVLNGRS
jgi:hypothetical protein